MYYATAISYVALLVSGHAQVLDIPEVDELVDAALQPFSQYTAYDGPTGSATSALSGKTATAKVYAEVAAADTDASYWLADITHQGIAAFNSNPSTYTVFRNVKDYGAAGDYPLNNIGSQERGD